MQWGYHVLHYNIKYISYINVKCAIYINICVQKFHGVRRDCVKSRWNALKNDTR